MTLLYFKRLFEVMMLFRGFARLQLCRVSRQHSLLQDSLHALQRIILPTTFRATEQTA